MNIHVKYFGCLVDNTGKNTEKIAIKNATVEKLLTKLGEKYPSLNQELYAVFINNKKADKEESQLKDNDEICLMPPFAGG